MTTADLDDGATVVPAGHDFRAVVAPKGRSVASALRAVILHVLTDVFVLHPHETMWAGEHLREILAGLEGVTPDAVALPVRHELLTRVYSESLSRAESTDDPADGPEWDPLCLRATTEDWAAVLMQMVTASYTLRPMAESSMQGQLIGLLRELGIGNLAAPRPARYMPNVVRARLTRRDV